MASTIFHAAMPKIAMSGQCDRKRGRADQTEDCVAHGIWGDLPLPSRGRLRDGTSHCRRVQRQSPRRVALASAVGTTIEWYDFFIYGTAAAVVFGPQFFPQVSELAGTLAAFATFAIGFIARPLGGVVMGHFGDRLGRKFMLVWSLMLMGLATLGIGLLPTYAQIGAWAPALLTTLPLRPGLRARRRMGRRRADVGRARAAGPARPVRQRRRAGPAGRHRPLEPRLHHRHPRRSRRSSSRAWGWRIPFIASVVLVAVGMFVRLSIAESPVFADVLRRGRGAADAGRRRPADRRAHRAAGGRQLRRHQRARIHPARVLRDATRRAASGCRCRRRCC